MEKALFSRCDKDEESGGISACKYCFVEIEDHTNYILKQSHERNEYIKRQKKENNRR